MRLRKAPRPVSDTHDGHAQAASVAAKGFRSFRLGREMLELAGMQDVLPWTTDNFLKCNLVVSVKCGPMSATRHREFYEP